MYETNYLRYAGTASVYSSYSSYVTTTFGTYTYCAYFKLMADLDMSAYYWTPLGLWDTKVYSYVDYWGTWYVSSDLTAFEGVFDGNGYTISGITMSSAAFASGVFGYCNGATIQNLNITNATILVTYHGGGIVGNGRGTTTITGCTFSGTVKSSGSSMDIGGITGGECDVSYCANYGTVTSSCGGVGGIIGYIYDDEVISNCYNFGKITSSGKSYTPVGGIAGTNEGWGTIQYCRNSGTITGYEYVGGIIGDGYYELAIANCFNDGTITSYSGYSYTGGIAGMFTGGGAYSYRYGEAYPELSNCYNSGTVRGYLYVGGLVGYLNADVYACYNKGTVTYYSTASNYYGGCFGYSKSSTIINCFNIGTITPGSATTVGSFIGYDISSTIEYCYYSSTLCSYGAIADTDYSDDEAYYAVGVEYFDTATSAYSYMRTTTYWNSTYRWTFSTTYWLATTRYNLSDFNDAYPVLYFAYGAIYYRYASPTYQYYENFVSGITLTSTTLTGYTSYDYLTVTTAAGNWTSGDVYEAGATISDIMYGNVTLTSSASAITYSVTISTNSATGGSASVTSTPTYASWFNVTNTLYRTGYTFSGWRLTGMTSGISHRFGTSTSSYSTSTASSYTYSVDTGTTYYYNLRSTSGTVTMTAQWTAIAYTLTCELNGGTYSSSSSDIEQTFYITSSIALVTPTRTGYTFEGWKVTTANGNWTSGTTYSAGASLSSMYGDATLTAQWTANNPAYYDEEGGYWYVENGYMPQTKVTDSDLISALDSNAVIVAGVVGTMAGLNVQEYYYIDSDGNTTFYGKWNGNWYKIEAVKWRLAGTSSSTSGVCTTETYATTANIVYLGYYSSTELGEGDGYSVTSVTAFRTQIARVWTDAGSFSTTYLNTAYTDTIETFSSTGITSTTDTTTRTIYVSSLDEINSVNGSYAIEFSDLVSDMLAYLGYTNTYFTRNLGSNLNNIKCGTEGGAVTQRLATNYNGVCFTVKFSEYTCVS